MIPKTKTKESHRSINRGRRYEVDEIAANSSGRPSSIIPKEYWDDMQGRVDGEIRAEKFEEAPF